MGQQVVTRARYNLTTSGVKKGKLYNSLTSKVTPTDMGFRVSWIMQDYGMFMDAGVWGSNPSKADSVGMRYDPEEPRFNKKTGKWGKGKMVKDYGDIKYKGKQKGRNTNS